MSKAAAINRTIEAQRELGFPMERGGSVIIVDFLTDFMRIRFGIEAEDQLQARLERKYGPAEMRVTPDEERTYSPSDAKDVADWIERGLKEAQDTGDNEPLRRPLIQNVVLIVEALRAYASRPDTSDIPEAAEEGETLDDMAHAAEIEMFHARAKDVRDRLERWMGQTVDVRSRSFAELNAILQQLDRLCGQPVKPEDEAQGDAAAMTEGLRELWTGAKAEIDQVLGRDPDRLAHEAWQGTVAAEAEAVIRNMAPGPDYRPIEEVLHDMAENVANEDRGHSPLAHPVQELLDNINDGRWEIISYVPDSRVNYRLKFMREIKAARDRLSGLNPARTDLDRVYMELASAEDSSKATIKARIREGEKTPDHRRAPLVKNT